MAIDNYDYHADACENRAGADPTTYVAFFFNWAISRCLLSAELEKFCSEELAAVRAGEMTVKDFLYESCDGKLMAYHLQNDIAIFAGEYYLKGYIGDFDTFFSSTDDDCYTVPQSDENMRSIAALLDSRLADYLLQQGLSLHQVQTASYKPSL